MKTRRRTRHKPEQSVRKLRDRRASEPVGAGLWTRCSARARTRRRCCRPGEFAHLPKIWLYRESCCGIGGVTAGSSLAGGNAWRIWRAADFAKASLHKLGLNAHTSFFPTPLPIESL